MIAVALASACSASVNESTVEFGDPLLLAEGVTLGSPSWSPSSTDIVVDLTLRHAIATVPATGGDLEIIAEGAYLNDPSWSSNGDIAYIDKTNNERFLVLRKQGGNEDRFSIGPTGEIANRPWSPDGSRLAFSTAQSLGYVSGAIGKMFTQDRPRVRGSIGMFRWNPDGCSLQGISAQGLYDIDFQKRSSDLLIPEMGLPYSVDLNGEFWSRSKASRDQIIHHAPNGEAKNYVFGGEVRCLDASPNTLEIAVCVRGQGIFLLDVKSGSIKEVTRGAADNLARWSPDGQSIAFVRSAEGGNANLYVVSRTKE